MRATYRRRVAGEKSVEFGPFIIQRGRGDRTSFATKTGWTTERDRAWKLDTREQAVFFLRGRDGEIVPFESQAPVLHRAQVVLVGEKLSQDEALQMVRCERLVQEGVDACRQARAALLEIRDKRLYRQGYRTFEDYMARRWGYSARHGHRIVVDQNLLTAGAATEGDQLVTPQNESQARPLAALPAERQAEAWQEAVKSAPAGKVTAKHVQAAVEKRLPQKVAKTAKTVPVEDASGSVFDGLRDAIRKRIDARANRALEAIDQLAGTIASAPFQGHCRYARHEIETLRKVFCPRSL